MTKDISPPSRIIDFTLLNQEDESLTLHLAWTAPGGDFDYEKGRLNNEQLNPTLNLVEAFNSSVLIWKCPNPKFN